MVKLNEQDQRQMEKAKDLMKETPLEHMGFVRNLFFGRLRLDKLMPYPVQDEDEARRTDSLLEKLDVFLNEHVDARQIDLNEEIPTHVIDGLGELGVLGMTVPKKYGGGGFSHTAYCRVLQRVAQTCASTAVFISAHQSIGLKAILLKGTEDQKQRFLPDLASGKKIAAFCLSEPEVGSDAANVQTKARLSPDGKHWLLTGHKKYATNAALAGVMTVMAQTPGQDNGDTKPKVTAFIVTPDMAGFEVVSHNRSKCGIRGSWQGTLKFTDMAVPVENILGELGRGLKVALEVLDFGRCTLSAACVGGAQLAMRMCVQRARERRQFGREIGQFQLIKQKLAQMAELVYAMDAITYHAAGIVDRHDEDVMLETAISKLFCSESLWTVADEAVQIWGGEGYMQETGIERMLRDARINRIVEGTTEIMTSFVALMGMKAVGENLEQVLRAVTRHPIGNFRRITEFASHEWHDLLIGHDFDGLHPKLRGEGEQLTRAVKLLARDVEKVLRVHREGIIDKQLQQQRIALNVVDLYAMASILSKLNAVLEGKLLPSFVCDDRLATVERDLMVGKRFCLGAIDRFYQRRKLLNHNQDKHVLALADHLLDLPTEDDGNN